MQSYYIHFHIHEYIHMRDFHKENQKKELVKIHVTLYSGVKAFSPSSTAAEEKAVVPGHPYRGKSIPNKESCVWKRDFIPSPW